MQALHESCKWGNTPDGGMNRLSLNDDDKYVRDWFRDQTEALGCTVTVDAMGNQFARIAGRNDHLPPIAMGSHLDTQPAGGKYDGILGVISGLESLRTLRDANYENYAPIVLINWTNEEGARFPMSMCSSAVWAGIESLEKVHNLADLKGLKLKAELERIGYLGSVPCSYEASPISAHFEVHIEQGPILEAEKKMIGVVEGVQAMRWFEVSVKGREAHTGTTPMDRRSDALLGAAKMIVSINTLATKHKGLGSTGIINSLPQSTNTIPGRVTFSVDLRHMSDSSLQEMEGEVMASLHSIAESHNLIIQSRVTCDSPAVDFHRDNIDCVRASAEESGFSWRYMRSGACHDSVLTSKRVPTSMIFCPSKDGISHNPAEFSSDGECAAAAQVLCGAVVNYDRLLRQRHS